MAQHSKYAPGLDAVVVNYKTGDDLRAFGASLRAHPPTVPFGLAIINVDPESDDLAAARDVGRRLPGVIHVSAWENIGYGRACNKGAALGRREIIALFNADVVFTPGALDECFAALLTHPGWGVLGPRQVNQANQLTHGGIFGSDTAPYINEFMRYDRGQCSTVVDHAYSVAGSAYFIRRSTWDTLTACPTFQEACPGAEGAFLPTPLWFEETWCSVHARAHGEQVVYYGPAQLGHACSASIDRRPGEWRATTWVASQQMFRAACQLHHLEHN